MDPADLAPQSPPRERDSPGVAPSMFGATEGAEEPVRLDETAGVEEAAPSAEDRLQAAGIVGSAKAAGTGEGGNVVDDSEAREDGEYARELEGGGEEYESHREGDSVPGGVLSK
ncbi:hypothetical protein IE81DRAFT_12779 [Ceraceosorus guamensis]|uniref:Uncharacterized protein n=1 Tax=Ceraceosorus guamensis TaxID=1522189 RepID=A0A316W3Z0_9BASI|nr:hypothetical protein IE81DRAFT_12779 [Ceraceosorus guamensis]PWN44626.1 hypothetical protein IE81DRAFT_12779 [Ceraceosorus guamensis]